MANWYNFTNNSTHYYQGSYGSTSSLQKYKAIFQYDADDSTPTRVKCRIKFDNDKWSNGSGTDYFYVYFPSTGSSMMVHNGNTKVIPDYTPTFYLYKSSFADGFTVPEFWICCQGRQGTLGTFSYSYFDPNSGSRKNFVTKITSSLPYYDGWTPLQFSSGAGESGSLKVYDTGNNTIGIEGTITCAKTWYAGYPFPNNVTGVSLGYKFNNSNRATLPVNKNSSGNYNSVSFSTYAGIPSGATNVSLDLGCTGTYNNPGTTNASCTVKYYSSPPTFNAPQKPKIEAYKDATLSTPVTKATKNSYLKISWKKGTGAANSTVSGCRLYIFTRKASATGWSDNGVSNKATHGYKYSDIYYVNTTTGLNSTTSAVALSNKKSYTVTIDQSGNVHTSIPCSDLGLTNKGDRIKVWIEPWHWHKDIWGNSRWWVTTVEDISGNHVSNEIVLGSSGVMRVKTSSGWKEGQVWVKTSSGWKESTGVYVRVSGGWEEST